MSASYSQEPYRPVGPGAYAAAPMHPQYNPMPVSRPPMPDSLNQPSDALASLAPGTQPTTTGPEVRSCVEKGWKYELLVVQQPQRARMCGFGDKDRRPITPPPCVRLIITDVNTGKECDVNDIDHGMFVLNVDLWDAHGSREVNLVRHSQTSPSISMTTAVSYAHVEHGSHTAFSHILPGAGNPQIKFEHGAGPSYAQPPTYPNPYGAAPINPYTQPPSPQQTYGGQSYHPAYAPVTTAPHYAPQNGYAQPGAPPPNMYYPGQPMHPQQQLDFTPVSQALPSQNPMGGYGGRPGYPPQDMVQRIPRVEPPSGMFTRNLIGSLAASAFRLTDPDDRIGIWFVLQDLSVRTEGTFRLKFSFVNVGVPSPPTSAGGSGSNGTQPVTQVNTGKAPVLAACYSDSFTVYSAKRFPGVVESTGLSKCFATQGIKIPIRKDGQATGRQSERDKEYDED